MPPVRSLAAAAVVAGGLLGLASTAALPPAPPAQMRCFPPGTEGLWIETAPFLAPLIGPRTPRFWGCPDNRESWEA